MNRRAFTFGTGMFVILNLLMLAITPMPAQAAIVWSDDFDDGNLDGWTTDYPERFTCENGYLEYIGPAETTSIGHDSNESLGTWSFDYFQIGDAFRINFWTDGTVSFTVELESVRINYIRWAGFPEDIRATWNSPVNLFNSWNHIDITVQDPFVVDIFLNGTHIIHNVFGIAPTNPCESFNFNSGDSGEAIDNVTVSDTVDVECTNETCTLEHYEPPTTTTPTDTTETTDTTTTTDGTTTPPPVIPLELLAVGIGVPVVIIVVVVAMRMRRS